MKQRTKKEVLPEVGKRSISAPKELFAKADSIAKKRMIGTFSGYVQRLIQDDVSKEAA